MTRMVYGGPIYPVPVKPPSRYNRWRDWPEELVPAIQRLVRGWYRVGVFKCWDCEAFCESHPHGAAHVRTGRARGDRDRGVPICDDCLIEAAKTYQSGDLYPAEG